MNAEQFIGLIENLHAEDQEIERLQFYAKIEQFKSGKPGKEAEARYENGPFGTYAADTSHGIHLWDTEGGAWLIPYSFSP